MKLGRLPSLFLLRGVVRELTGVRQQLAIQNTLLSRLADRFAPIDPETDPAIVRSETGVTYTDPLDQQLILRYAERIHADTGHWPTDDELLIYLADEKTRDLHTRLAEREAELLQRSRDPRG